MRKKGRLRDRKSRFRGWQRAMAMFLAVFMLFSIIPENAVLAESLEMSDAVGETVSEQPETPEVQPEEIQPETPEPQPEEIQPETPEVQPEEIQPETPEVQPEEIQPETPEPQPEEIQPETPEFQPEEVLPPETEFVPSPDTPVEELPETGAQPETREMDAVLEAVFMSGYAKIKSGTFLYHEKEASAEMGSLKKDAVIYVLERNGDGSSEEEWCRIAFACRDDKEAVSVFEGYVKAKFLEPVEAEKLNELKDNMRREETVVFWNNDENIPLLAADFAFAEKESGETENQDTLPPSENDVSVIADGDVHTFTDEATGILFNVPAGSLQKDGQPIEDASAIEAALHVEKENISDAAKSWLEGYHQYIGYTLVGGGTYQFYRLTLEEGVTIKQEAPVTAILPASGASDGKTPITWVMGDDDQPVNNSWKIGSNEITVTGSGVYGITNVKERHDINIDGPVLADLEEEVELRFVWQHGYAHAARWEWQYSADLNGNDWHPVPLAPDGPYEISGGINEPEFICKFTFKEELCGRHYRLAALDESGAVLGGSDVITVYNRGEAGELDHSNPLEAAEYYYGDKAASPLSVGSVSINGSDMTVLAGETRTFTISYLFQGAAKAQYQHGLKSLFDSYDDAKIHLKLPQGVSVQAPDGIEMQVDETTNTYTFVLPSHIDAASAYNGAFDISLRVDDNGAVAAGEGFFIEPSKVLSMETDFTIIDKTVMGGFLTTDKSYHKKVDSASGSFTVTTTTNDRWVIAKSAESTGNVSLDDAKKVTVDGNDYLQVQFALEVGLESQTGQMTDPNLYLVNGRVPFVNNQIQLTEKLVLKGRDGQTLNAAPHKITISPVFGEKQEYTVANGSPVSVPVDTLGDRGNGKDVSPNAPYYSAYRVTVLYDYNLFLAEWTDKNQGTLQIENEVTLDYTLKGCAPAEPQKDEASQSYGDVTKPAHLKVEKYIRSEAGDTLYSSSNLNALSGIEGPAVFEVIRLKDGETVPGADSEAAKLYKKDGSGYTQLSGNKVAVHPGDAGNVSEIAWTGKEGFADIYLEPGNYYIREVQAPENTEQTDEGVPVTIGADETKPVPFYNKELLGSVEIVKHGGVPGQTFDEGTPLAGAEFTIYRKNADNTETQVSTQTSKADGKLSFERLPYGNYIIRETKVPEGYLPDYSRQIAIDADKQNHTLEFMNRHNVAPLTLQKMIYDEASGTYVSVNSSTKGEFNGVFVLQQGTGVNEAAIDWKDYDGISHGLNDDGQLIVPDLPIFNEDGQRYWYRFQETLPDNWFEADTENFEDTQDRVVYSQAVQLLDEDGKIPNGGKGAVVTLENVRAGELSVNKTFYDLDDTGKYVKNSGETAEFMLYRRLGSDGTVETVGEPRQTDKNGRIHVDNLPRFKEVNKKNVVYEYFWAEISQDPQYKLVGKTLTTVETEDGTKIEAVGPITLTGTAPADWSKTENLENCQQLAPVQIRKFDYYLKRWDAGLSGTEFKVYDVTGKNPAADGKYDVSQETEIKNGVFDTSAAVKLKLEPGHTYYVEESLCPDGYTMEEAQVNGNKTSAGIGWAVFTIPDEVTHSTAVTTVTLVNRPAPKIVIHKRLHKYNPSTGSWYDFPMAANAVTFSVYTMSDAGLTPYDKLSMLQSGSQTRLEAGVYYLEEQIEDDNKNHILEPSLHPDAYDAKADSGEIQSGWVQIGQKTYFKITVDAVTEPTDKIQEFTADNHTNEGILKITKKDDGGDLLAGAEFILWGIDSNGQEISIEKKTGTTNAQGELVFSGLPIYDGKGQKISYHIKETKVPENHYDPNGGKEIEIELKKEKVVEKEYVNNRYNTFEVTKSYKDLWEFSFTGNTYPLSDVKVALYQWNEEEHAYGYTGKIEHTDIMGMVLFDGLKNGTYVAIEASIPEEYENVEPQSGEVLGNPEGHLRITEDELEKYNYTKMVTDSQNPYQKGELTNVKHWTQIAVHKWGRTDDGKADVNFAEFEIYKQDVSGLDGDEVLEFEPDNLEQYELVGSYSTGTLYDTDGKRQNGWFASDIMVSSEDIVYWLVETKSGSGFEIIPENKYILLRREGTQFTNETTYEDEDGQTVTCKGVADYKDDARTTVEVENTPVDGPGKASFASVRIAKWGQKYDEYGELLEEYHPLGNAVFELWVMDKDGNQILKLDDLTTGLDNDLTSETEDGLTGWAASKTFEYRDIVARVEEKIRENLKNSGTDEPTADEIQAEIDRLEIFTSSGQNEDEEFLYVRAGLVEVDAPLKYVGDGRTHYMNMAFLKADSVTEVFNDAYYATDANFDDEVTGYKKAADQEGIVWATYAAHSNGAPYEGAENTSIYRLVNWQVNEFPVQVHKYGYTPTSENVGKDSKALDEYYKTHSGRTALNGVTMALSKYNNGTRTFVPYDYLNNSRAEEKKDSYFTTGTGGVFTFPKGLTTGWYRIEEIEGVDGYENIYNLSDDYRSLARYFHVGDNGGQIIEVSMYNPKMLNLEIQKTDLDGESIQGKNQLITFTLTDVRDSEKSVNGMIDANGTVVLKSIPTGTYYLTEAAQPGSGLSDAYLKEYIMKAYPSLGDLVDPNRGLRLGYNVTLYPPISEQNQNASDTVVRAILDFEHYIEGGTAGDLDNQGGNGLSIPIADPPMVSLTLEKQREKTENYNVDTKLKGAVFAVYYRPFANFDSETIVDILPSGDTGDSLNGWELLGKNYKTGADGTVTLSGQAPGIFYVVEAEAPEHYEKLPDQTGQIIVLTGGMKVSVNAEKTGLTPKIEGSSYKASFENRYTLPLTVTKKLDTGKLGTEPDFKVKFNLYDSENGTQPVDSVTVTKEKPTATFQKRLTKEKTYYLEEVQEEGFILQSAELDNADDVTLIEGSDKRYALTARENREADVNVTFTNQWLHARATIFKADAKTGAGLTGAEFTIYQVVAVSSSEVKEVLVDGAKWTSDDNGEYTVDIPMDSAGETTYRIYETKAPDYYVGDPDAYIEIKLSPEDVYTYTSVNAPLDKTALRNGVMPNENGFDIVVTKYDNVVSSDDKNPLQGAGFRLYYKNGDNWELYRPEVKTDEKGQVRFTVLNGTAYALAESTIPSGYAGLDSLWENDTEVKGEMSGDVMLYPLNNGREVWDIANNAEVEIKAYNMPKVNLVIQKTDAENPDNIQTVEVAVYKLKNEQITPDMTPEEILALAKNKGGFVGTYQTTNSGNASSVTIPGAIGGNTYVAEEVKVLGGGNAIIRTDSRVKWTDYVTIPEGTKEDQTLELTNISGHVSADVKKSVDREVIPSLFDGGTTLTYTITPTAPDNTYALDGYTVTDPKLEAYHGADKQLLEEDYLKEHYHYTQVEVSKAEHDVSSFMSASAPIWAEVTFYDDEGTPVESSRKEIESRNIFTAPAGAASFQVRYDSPLLQEATKDNIYLDGTGYTLGKDFTPGQIKAVMELEQQQDGYQNGELVKSIDWIKNTVSVEAVYRPWDNEGKIQEKTSKTATASAETKVEAIKVPTLNVSKAAGSEQVYVGNTLKYTITITNSDKENSGKPVKALMAADLLPFGALLDTSDDGGVRITDGGDSNLEISDVSTRICGTGTGAGTVVLIRLDNQDRSGLKPGDSVTLELDMKVDEGVVSYKPQMFNNVYVTSEEKGVQYTDNPRGVSYKNEEKAWALELSELASPNVDTDEGRLDALAELLGDRYKDAGFITAFDDVTWMTQSGITVLKENYGSLDDKIFRSDRTAYTQKEDGWVMYRLTVNRDSGKEIGQLGLIDTLPAQNDRESNGAHRHSQWPLFFDELTSVKVGGQKLKADEYTVYYFTGDATSLSGSSNETKNAYTQLRDGTPPTNWQTDVPTDKTAITAFAVLVDGSYRLSEDVPNLTVEYKTVVNSDRIGTEAEYRCSNNTFGFMGTAYESEGSDKGEDLETTLGSNAVSVMMAPERVSVGGNVWIDANENDVQDAGEVLSSGDFMYGNYKIVQELLEGLDITLHTYVGSAGAPNSSIFDKTGQDWTGEFQFDNLISAQAQQHATEDQLYPDKKLDPALLYGDAPSTYILRADYQNNPGFGLARLGEESYRSYDPKVLASGTHSAATDNNFSGDTQSSVSERFYLWASDETDMSKDIGFTLDRKLTITKVDEDNPNKKIAGAKFNVYGPLTEEQIENGDIYGAPLAGQAETNGSGIAEFNGLMFFQRYLIVEDTVPAGYDGSIAQVLQTSVGTSLEVYEGGYHGKDAWVLGIPDKSSTNLDETVTISNKRKPAQFSLEVSKILEGKDFNAGDFTFVLKDSEGNIVEKTNGEPDRSGKAAVAFDPIKVYKEGIYEYTITEKIPDEAVTGVYQGITYDSGTITATVSVIWKPGKGLEAETPSYSYSGTASSNSGNTFTNRYQATGSWTPEGTKVLTGRDMKPQETFTFVVKEGSKVVSLGEASGGKNGTPVPVTFTPVSYTLQDVGTHTYTIRESGTDRDGLTIDPNSYEVTVTVTDQGDGTLLAVPTYKGGSLQFHNSYTVQPASYEPKVRKTLTGTKPKKDTKFHFVLSEAPEQSNPKDGFALPKNKDLYMTIQEPGAAGSRTDVFDAITFTKAGTYYFLIQEADDGQNGFAYDKAKWTLMVKVEDDGLGQLVIPQMDGITYISSAQGMQPSDEEASFINEYEPLPVLHSLQVKKSMSSDSAVLPGSKAFTFQLEEASGTNYGSAVEMPETDTAVITIDPQTGSSASGVFDAIKFTKEGEYQFVIGEIPESAADAPGYEFDKTKWTVTVKVEDQDGQLTVTQTTYANGSRNADWAEFVNGYKTEDTQYVPQVMKTLTGDPIPAAREFTFTIRPDSSNLTGGAVLGQTQTSITLKEGQGQASFEEIVFKKAGTYKFFIEETGTAPAGYQYDTSKWILTVPVTDVNGRLTVDEENVTYVKEGETSGAAQAAFENAYHTKEALYAPTVSKKVTGADRPDVQTFRFKLTADEHNMPGASLPENTVLDVAENETKSFDNITFDAAGEYIFYINEVAENLPAGYQHDPQKWTVKVTVTDKDSQLEAAAVYLKDGEKQKTDDAQFYNTYEPSAAVFTPKMRKQFSGDDRPAAKTFEFTMEAAGTYTEEEVVMGSSTVWVTGAEAKSFGTITFKRAGTYEFTMKEQESNENGYTIDKTPWTLTVQVEDKGGRLAVASAKYHRTVDGKEQISEAEAVFTNHYQVTPVSWSPEVEKTLEGMKPSQEKTFWFVLETLENPGSGAVLTGDTRIPLTLSDVGAANKQTGIFGEIQFTKTGVYKFRITEEAYNKDGYTTDTAEWTVEVQVTDHDSVLEKQVVYYKNGAAVHTGKAQFVNHYAVEETYFTPSVKKTITGAEPFVEETFVFTLEAGESNPWDGAVFGDGEDGTRIEISGAGSGQFLPVTFKQAGTYTFTIRETKGSAPGYVYDEESWTLTVKVEDKDSKLTVTDVEYRGGGKHEANSAEAIFTNHYQVTAADYQPKVEKVVNGEKRPEDETFRFRLSAAEETEEGMTLPKNTEAEITGSGSAMFDSIEFSRAGTYKFILEEINDQKPGYSYDGNIWLLTVVVEDVDSVLTVKEASYTKAANPEQKEDWAVFVNTYDTAQTTFTPKVEKVLAGAPAPSDETFRFRMEADSKNPEGAAMAPEGGEVSRTGAGTVNFSAITFDQSGVYRFRITEEKGNAAGYTYDDREWVLEVTVKDQKGVLAVTGYTYTSGKDTAKEAAVFTNTYQPQSTAYAPAVKKTITGVEPSVDETFVFTLEAGESNPRDGAVFGDGEDGTRLEISGAGSGQFLPITFKQAGAYTFIIRETKGSAPGYVYDEESWTLTVKVEDKDSKLTVTDAEYRGGGKHESNSAEAIFTNHYQVTAADYQPKVEKVVNGEKRPEDETFRFRLSAAEETAEGMTLPKNTEAEITGSGSAMFDSIEFSRAGTYKFILEEINDQKPGYSYDGNIWLLTVVVEDVDSVLTVKEASYTKAANPEQNEDVAVFVNTYDTAQTTFTPKVEKALAGAPAPSDETFRFRLEADSKNPEGAAMAPEGGEVSLTGAGTVNFSAITFDQSGVYRFRITEEKGNAAGYTYDDREWVLEVTVEELDGVLAVTGCTYTSGKDTAKEAAVFTNTYQPESTAYAPVVKKTVTGDAPSEETFRFTLASRPENPAGAQLPQNTEAEITGSGETMFEEIVFDEAGTYVYEIAEENTGKPGYTYDGTIWTVTVSVTDRGGKLAVEEVTYAASADAPSDGEAAQFVNHYQTDRVAYTPRVTKVITGDKTPEDKMFTFTLCQDASNPEGAQMAAEPVRVKGAGSAAFQPVTFTKTGTYRFRMEEVEGTEAGYTYDQSQWILTVEVTDVGGALAVKAAYDQSGTGNTSETAAVFVNQYSQKKAVDGAVVQNPVRTGDDTHPFATAALMFLSLMLATALLKKRKEQNAE